MKKIFSWLWLAGAACWLAILARPLGPLPAIGPLRLDFKTGIWNHDDFVWQNRKIPGLKEPVEIAVDTNGIPHIFAKSEHDLYLAQGYIMASQRLFQMDLSTRAVTGHLSELVGAKGLTIDRYFVKLGMRQSVLKTTNDYMSNPQVAAALTSFTEGVNAYIRGLTQLPPEYKLIGQRPQTFDPSRAIGMARALTYNLNSRGEDLVLSHLAQQIGVGKVLDLFPEFMPDEFSDYVLPGAWSKTKRKPETAELFKFQTHIKNFPEIPQPSRGNGSNNWVVGPKKSKTGHSILANDTHLCYSLPGIWFENQLVCPEFNVYGVSLPDIPGIVAGFNGPVAWGPTNGTTDAIDYLEVEFKDEASRTYLSHGVEKEAQVFPETITVANGPSETIDVLWTEWGPVLYREGRYGLAVNWTSFQPKQELHAVRRLYNAGDAKSCLQAFDEWAVPIQNFVCADADHIGIRHAGFLPKRDVGEGRFIAKAGESRYDLRVPVEPQLQLQRLDPKENYLHSANERIADQTYPYYLGWDYEEPFRGARIRKLLESQDKFSGEDLIKMQTDAFDGQAELALPYMLKALDRSKLEPEQLRWVEKLEHWDLIARADSVEPTIYKTWFRHLQSEIFSDEYELPERKNFLPFGIRTIWLLKRVSENPADPDAEWVDNKRTPEKESLSQVVTSALLGAWSQNKNNLGANPAGWTWSRANVTRVDHIAKLPGFGSPLLAMNGTAQSIQANMGWHGPVYKFVIELGPDTRAWMQTPGATSGDPFTPAFDRNAPEWAAGKMRQVRRYKDVEDARSDGLQIYEYGPEK